MALPSSQGPDPSDLSSFQGGGAGNPGTFMGSDIQAAKKKRMIDQVLQQRQQAQSSMGLLRMGGPEYFDQIDQMRMNPMNTFF